MDLQTVVVIPCTRCNVNCAHCMHCANMNGFDMPFEFLEKYVERFLAEEIIVNTQITGRGEPLLYAHFDRMIDLFLEKSPYKSTIFTAGYNASEWEKRERLLSLISKNSQHDFLLNVSYNAFADFDARLKMLLSDLLLVNQIVVLFLRMCVSDENVQEVTENLKRVLINVVKENGLPDVGTCGTSDRSCDWPEYLKEYRYVIHGPSRDIRVQTNFIGLKKAGNALSLKGYSYDPSVCELLCSQEETYVALYADGYFYACDEHIGLEKRRIGHIMEDSLKSVFRRRDALRKKASRMIHPLGKIFGKLPCSLCKKLI